MNFDQRTFAPSKTEKPMKFRLSLALIALVSLCACSDKVSGQKGRTSALITNIDSVSYGIGTDIGANLLQSGLDSLNIDAMAQGIKDAIDSNEVIPSEKVRGIVQAYMIEAQRKAMAKTQKEGEKNKGIGDAWLAENAKRPGVKVTESGLQYEVLQDGKGAKPVASDAVKVDYRGTLIDGSEFDSSYSRGEPATFGVGNVIQGWVEGLQLMSPGARYKFYIPSDLAYGASQGPGGKLPPHSALIFEVTLLEVNPK